MDRCDICQGRGVIQVLETANVITMMSNSEVLSSRNQLQLKREQCPKCDGKGMVHKK